MTVAIASFFMFLLRIDCICVGLLFFLLFAVLVFFVFCLPFVFFLYAFPLFYSFCFTVYFVCVFVFCNSVVFTFFLAFVLLLYFLDCADLLFGVFLFFVCFLFFQVSIISTFSFSLADITLCLGYLPSQTDRLMALPKDGPSIR